MVCNLNCKAATWTGSRNICKDMINATLRIFSNTCCFKDQLTESFWLYSINILLTDTRFGQSLIRSDKGLTLETSAFESLYGGQFTLSTQLIKPNYLVILPPTQHHSFFRNLPPLFVCCLSLRPLTTCSSILYSTDFRFHRFQTRRPTTRRCQAWRNSPRSYARKS